MLKPSKDYINFIIFYHPDKNVEVSTLININNSNIANRFLWESNNKSLKEIQSLTLSTLKISGFHLPLYGPYSKYDSIKDELSREFYQGILLNSSIPIPNNFIHKPFYSIKPLINDAKLLEVYELIHAQLQDYISRKYAGY